MEAFFDWWIWHPEICLKNVCINSCNFSYCVGNGSATYVKCDIIVYSKRIISEVLMLLSEYFLKLEVILRRAIIASLPGVDNSH